MTEKNTVGINSQTGQPRRTLDGVEKNTSYLEMKLKLEGVLKVKVLDMEKFIGQPRSVVMKEIAENYKDKYHFGNKEDEEYLRSLSEDKIPEEMKSGKNLYFPSHLPEHVDRAGAPCILWMGSDRGFAPIGYSLEGDWTENDRVCLFER